jgi:steroid delta-isomerase-like uncharacterized protein
MVTVNELLDRFVEQFNSGRFEEAQEDFAPDGYSEEIGTNRRLTPAEGVANARAWKQAFPDARGTIATKIAEGNKGAAEIVWRGTNTGPLMDQPPTGKQVTVRAVVVIETNGQKIVRTSQYIDVASMMAQLGASQGV